MKKINLPIAVKKFILLLLFTPLSMVAFGATIICTTPSELKDAMENALPGDEIIVMPGVYEPGGKVKDAINKFVRFTSDRSGTAANPIILRGSSSTNRPLLQCPDNDIYDGAVISITGDYWELKDLKVAQGDKGIMLDTANYCTLYNIDVQDIAEEAIHIRSGSSNNTIDNCTISNTGVIKPQFGEGIYIGSDRGQHDTYDPNCNNNLIQNCVLGPDIRAEHFDIKEGTEYNIVRNCIMDGTGISGENSADSFLDIKGIYTSVYSNTFNVNGNSTINSFIDFNNRTTNDYDYKTGFKNEFFDNTFNTGDLTSIPSATSKGKVSDEIHVYDNTRNPDSPWVKTSNTAKSTDDYESRPSWSPEPNQFLSTEEFESIGDLKLFPNPSVDKLNINGINLNSTSYSILDINGKSIQQNALLSQDFIDISNLSKGTYILQLKTANSAASKLFVKE